MPPATTSPARPSSTYCAAVAMALVPDRQTLLTVRAGTVIGTPARTAAWRAVIWPCPAWSTWPMTTCSAAPGEIPARSQALAMARPPSSTAVSGDRTPPNRPTGVRAPAQMTGCVRSNIYAVYRYRRATRVRSRVRAEPPAAVDGRGRLGGAARLGQGGDQPARPGVRLQLRVRGPAGIRPGRPGRRGAGLPRGGPRLRARARLAVVEGGSRGRPRAARLPQGGDPDVPPGGRRPGPGDRTPHARAGPRSGPGGAPAVAVHRAGRGRRPRLGLGRLGSRLHRRGLGAPPGGLGWRVRLAWPIRPDERIRHCSSTVSITSASP